MTFWAMTGLAGVVLVAGGDLAYSARVKLLGLGLRGKFLLALIVAAVVPLVIGVLVLQTAGFQHLLAERGRVHEAEARALAKGLDLALVAEGGKLRAWIRAGGVVTEFAEREGGIDAEQAARDLSEREGRWLGLEASDPLLVEILANPASENLMIFERESPAVAEVVVADRYGRLIAATRKTSDYDQSDEAWWKEGVELEWDGAWADALHFDSSAGIYSLDLVFPLVVEGGETVGVVKMVVEVSSVFHRLGMLRRDEEVEVVLADGRVIVRPGDRGEVVGQSLELDREALLKMWVGRNGWMMVEDSGGEQWMAGFAAIQSTLENRQRQEPGGYVLFASRRGDVVAPLRVRLAWVALFAGLGVLLCMLVGYALVHRGILRPLASLREAARAVTDSTRSQLGDGSDDEAVELARLQAEEELRKIESIRTGDQIEALAGDIGVMTWRVLRYQRELESDVKAKASVIQEDLEMAREFQQALLPSDYPQMPKGAKHPLRLGFAHYYEPASTVGGDFFDLVELDHGKVAVLIADVMGHGARSALVTAILRSMVRNQAQQLAEPADFLASLNDHLHQLISRSGQEMFVSAFLVVLDPAGKRLSWAVAGHPSPLRARRGSGREPKRLWSESLRQPALGLIEAVTYTRHDEELRAGDVFLLYTDGLVEVENPGGEQYGLARLKHAFDQALDGPLAAMPAQVVCQASAFHKAKQYDDDVCVVVVEASVNRAVEN